VAEPSAAGEHYFTADPSVPFTRTPVRAQVWGRTLALTSGAGVFAQGRLDLGCGYGVVALALATARPDAQVWAVDVNQRALLLARENASSLGVADRLHVAEPGAVPPGLRFDEIWSNPPIRIGKQALHDLLLTWLPRLSPGGRAVLVVGKNLGADSLQRWLGDQGFGTARLASAKGFRVFEVRPRAEGTGRAG
jgi:16S rRNA (guanine1207-N2)-methyltransferase